MEVGQRRWGGYTDGSTPVATTAETALYYLNGDLNPPDMEFRIGAAMSKEHQMVSFLEGAHFQVGIC